MPTAIDSVGDPGTILVDEIEINDEDDWKTQSSLPFTLFRMTTLWSCDPVLRLHTTQRACCPIDLLDGVAWVWEDKRVLLRR